jgi:hypothetical protein
LKDGGFPDFLKMRTETGSTLAPRKSLLNCGAVHVEKQNPILGSRDDQD